MSIEQFPTASGSSGTVTSVAGGVGITNTPEPIVGAGTVDLDINSLTTETVISDGDLFPFVDVSVGTTPAAQRKVTAANLRTGIGPESDPRRVAWWQVSGETKGTIDDAAGTAITITQTGVAAGAVLSDATGRYDSLVNAGGGASPCGWLTTAPSLKRQYLPDITWVMKTGPAATDITNIRLWCIAADASSDFAVAVPPSAFGFRFNPADAGDGSWIAFTSNAASTASTITTGVAVVVDTRYVFRAVWTTTGTVDFYINGVFFGTLSTTANMPALGASLFWQLRLVNATGVVRAVRTSRVYLTEF